MGSSVVPDLREGKGDLVGPSRILAHNGRQLQPRFRACDLAYTCLGSPESWARTEQCRRGAGP